MACRALSSFTRFRVSDKTRTLPPIALRQFEKWRESDTDRLAIFEDQDIDQPANAPFAPAGFSEAQQQEAENSLSLTANQTTLLMSEPTSGVPVPPQAVLRVMGNDGYPNWIQSEQR